ncbi:MAG: DNA repair protein RecO [Clostridium fessum]
MRDLIQTTGMVLYAAPVGEFDKRLILLTGDRGKITAFARGAKRTGSLLRAASRPFAFGTFTLSETRDAYNLYGAEIENYFEGLEQDVSAPATPPILLNSPNTGRRSGEKMPRLSPVLPRPPKTALPNKLVQRIFELKIMVINGEYTEDPPLRAGDSARYAWQYVIYAPIEKLYTFLLKEDAFAQFAANVERNKRAYVDKSFHSLEILQTIT